MSKIMLREIAHSRAGDKGNISNISVIPYKKEDYELVKREVTAEKVKEYFKGICYGKVTRYECPKICALNFVLEEALDGGNTRSLRVDGYGKSLSGYMMSMYINAE